jgi:hypothetical protein
MKKEFKIENVIIIGGAGYLLYTLATTLGGKKKEGNQKVEEIPNVNLQTYTDKVKAIQKALSLQADGIVGKQTNGTLEMLWGDPYRTIGFETSFKANYPNLKRNGKGVLTADNVDYYFDALKNKTYPSSKTATSVTSTTQDGFALKNNYAKGGVLKVKNTGARFNEVSYDYRNDTYVTTGKVVGYDKDASFVTPELFARGQVRIEAVTKLGNVIVKIEPTFGKKYLLSIPAKELYLSK